MMAPDMLDDILGRVDRRTRNIFGGYALAFVLVALTVLLDLPPLVRFGASVIALAGGAVAVGEATERLAHRLSPAATGVVQSTAVAPTALHAEVYAKAALVLRTLDGVLGDARLRDALRAYVDAWRFRHPTSRDWRTLIEERSGMDLAPLFSQLFDGTGQLDYAVARIDVSEVPALRPVSEAGGEEIAD